VSITLNLATRSGQMERLELEINLASRENQLDGFSPVLPSAKREALRFLANLTQAGNLSILPAVGLGEDGSLGLLFADDVKYIYFDFTADNRFHYYGRVGSALIAEVVQAQPDRYDAVSVTFGEYLLDEDAPQFSTVSFLSDYVVNVSPKQLMRQSPAFEMAVSTRGDSSLSLELVGVA
jgi:hypothetical protein